MTTNLLTVPTILCGECGTRLAEVLRCPSCGTKNRVRVRFIEHQNILCARCQHPLTLHQFEPVVAASSASKTMMRNALFIEGKLHQWKGEWTTAISLFQQAQKYGDDHQAIRRGFALSIGLCHAYLGNRKDAEAFLKALDVSQFRSFRDVYELARAYGLTGKLERAIACFETARAFATDPNSIDHLDAIIEALHTIRETSGVRPTMLETCILLHDARRDYETYAFQAGIRKLQRALELDHGNPEIYHQLGIGLLQQGQFEEAIALLERGLEFDPVNERAQFALGDAYLHLGMYECALNAYKQTLGLNPRHIDAYHHLGLVYEQQGDIEAAKGYWEDVLQVNPTHRDAIRCLSRYSIIPQH